MHILEAYSTSCGLKIDKPFISEKFYAIPADKYITIHTGDGKYDSRNYSYWQDVVDFLSVFLAKEGISIVQVGGEKDPSLKNLINSNGRTSINQLAFILKNSLLHLGIDSLPIHLASSYGKKIVALYSNVPSQNSGPYWSEKKDVILIESDKDGDKPTYAKVEIPRTIDTIKPDKIFRSVLDLLNIDYKFPYKVLALGKEYNKTVVEYIPDYKFNLKKVSPLFIRMDLEHNEEMASDCLKNNKAVVITNKPLSDSFLEKNKPNIQSIMLRVNEAGLSSFAERVKNNCIELRVISKLKGEELEDIKMEFLDISLVKSEKIIKKQDIKALDGIDINSLFYLPNKFTLSKGKVFDSVYAYKQNEPSDQLVKKLKKLKYDHDDFWDESEHFCFLEKVLTEDQE